MDKTFLAKSEIAWLQEPHIVSKGAQYSFARFAKDITEKLEKDSLSITSHYFKEAIARILMFREVETIISRSSWYAGGYRAQCVAYTLTYLSHYLTKNGLLLDFMKIWDTQRVPAPLKKVLSIIAQHVYANILNGNANAGEWCKTQSCWESIKNMALHLEIDADILTNAEEQKYIKGEAKKDKKLTTGIEIQTFVVNFQDWAQILAYYQQDHLSGQLSTKQMDILSKMAQGALYPPSEKQAKILCGLYEDALREGFVLASAPTDFSP